MALSVTLNSIAAPPEPKLDPKAAEIARAMMQAMGGETAWKQARYVRFDFSIRVRGEPSVGRAHLWDKQTGRYRLEDKTANEQFAVVLFNVRDRQGTAYAAGKQLEGAAATRALQGAYRVYQTDTDWLALPWNWLAPGVHLKYVGEKSVNDQSYEVVEVTVDQPNGTAARRYTSYVSPRSHLLEYWSVGTDTTLWDWQYTRAGGIQLASSHANTQRHVTISMGNVKVLDKVDDAFLTDPEHRLSMLK